jgi:hypothetical protein
MALSAAADHGTGQAEHAVLAADLGSRAPQADLAWRGCNRTGGLVRIGSGTGCSCCRPGQAGGGSAKETDEPVDSLAGDREG